MHIVSPCSDQDLLKLGMSHGAVYVCPKDGSTRKGPLVAYAGKDKYGRNLVGDIYFNFRTIEQYPEVVRDFAIAAYCKLSEQCLLSSFDTICGIPNGGRTFGLMLALVAGKRFVYPEKKPKPTGLGKKQEYDWDLSQFDFSPGERVAVAEDVFNNFQNTDHTLDAIRDTGAQVALLVGALNRSPVYDRFYKDLPVIASIRKAYPEYTQDDPEVAADIAAGNLELEVKKNWALLTNAMRC